MKEFVPEVTCTVDGYGGSNIRKTKRAKLRDIMENAGVAVKNNATIREKRFVVKDKKKRLAGGLRVIHEPGQEDVKAKLTERLVNMPSFWKVAEKRKANLEDFSEENLKRKCTRRSPHQELFDDAWNEHLDEVFPWSKEEL